MDITSQKLQLISGILQLHDKSVIETINTLLKNKLKEKYNTDKLLSEEIIQKLLLQSENEYLNREVTEHDAFENEAMSWE